MECGMEKIVRTVKKGRKEYLLLAVEWEGSCMSSKTVRSWKLRFNWFRVTSRMLRTIYGLSISWTTALASCQSTPTFTIFATTSSPVLLIVNCLSLLFYPPVNKSTLWLWVISSTLTKPIRTNGTALWLHFSTTTSEISSSISDWFTTCWKMEVYG